MTNRVDLRTEREQKLFFLFVLFALCFFLVSCASKPFQSTDLMTDRSLKIRQHEIANVPFIKQSDNHCGPSTLSMVLQFWGDSAELADLSKQTYTGKAQGTFQTDMISAARRRGYMAVPIQGYNALIKEISNGHPVIVFENLGLSWFPQWHYAVVHGFDLDKQRLNLHSGPDKNITQNMKDFERDWMLGDYWGLVILPAGDLVESATEVQNATAAAALENLQFFDLAEKSYQSILQKWPQSLIALTGMGNLMYRQGRLSKALDYFEEASLHHPESEAAQHNYMVLAQALKKIKYQY